MSALVVVGRHAIRVGGADKRGLASGLGASGLRGLFVPQSYGVPELAAVARMSHSASKEMTGPQPYGSKRAMITSHVHCRPRGLLMLLWLLVASCAAFSACRTAAEEGCSSNVECEDDFVCSSTGECEAPAARYEARREAFRRFGGDGAAYGLWLRYGTTGAPLPLQLHTGSSRIKDDGMARADDASHVFCSIQDVRTDDLLFNHTSAYPDGYWGASPIADGKSGRCGDDLETLTWRLLNCERIARGLVPVECDLRLVWIGRQHANDMATRDFFGHVNPDGLDAFRRLTGRGILYGLAGENLARQQSIFDAHAAWMSSSLHRRNILTEHYNYAGIGVIRSGRHLILSEAFLGGVDEEGALELPTPPPALEEGEGEGARGTKSERLESD